MAKILFLTCLFGSIFLALYNRLTRSEKADDAQSTPPATDAHPLSHSEAAEILGVSHNASEEDIRNAHRRLMKHIHPDGGGNNYFATRLNLARDILLKKRDS